MAELTTTLLTADDVKDLVERMLRTSGRRVDLSSPFVDAVLPDGSRLHVVIPDITREHWFVNIRKFVVKADRLEDLVRLGTLTRPAARFLEAAVAAGLNVLVAGGTQAGKTTLLNCLSAAILTRSIECTQSRQLTEHTRLSGICKLEDLLARDDPIAWRDERRSFQREIASYRRERMEEHARREVLRAKLADSTRQARQEIAAFILTHERQVSSQSEEELAIVEGEVRQDRD